MTKEQFAAALGYAQHTTACRIRLSEPSEEGTAAVLAPCTCGLQEIIDYWHSMREPLTSKPGVGTRLFWWFHERGWHILCTWMIVIAGILGLVGLWRHGKW